MLNRVAWDFLIAALVLPVIVVACDDGTTSPEGSGVQPPGTFEEALCPLELPASVLEGRDVVCGYVTVPEEHARPDGSTIRLAVAVIKSTSDDPAPDPLVVESGGPGISTVASLPSMLVQADLRAQRDIVLVEQCGTLYSEPFLHCTELRDLWPDILTRDLSVEEEVSLEVEALRVCHDRLIAEGINLSAYDSLENAADIVMALSALGYVQFNFYGVSYSTILAQNIMRDSPGSLRSVILDSVAPVSVNGFVQWPNSVDRALRLLFDSCTADVDCSERFPELESVFFNLVEKLNRDPVTVHFPTAADLDVVLTGDRFLWQLQMGLQRGPIPLLPAAIYAAADGDYSLMTSLGVPSLPSNMFISEVGMASSVLCAEEADYTEADFDLEGVYPQIAALIPHDYDIRDYCAVWNVEPLAAATGPIVSDIPTLIMSGQFDPNTPPSGGDLVAETLSNSGVYIFPGMTHSVMPDSLCAQRIMLDFLDDPTQEPDAACIGHMRLQFVVPTDDIDLRPYTDAEYGIRSVLPAGWAEVGPGLFAGLNSRGDLAFLTMARLPDVPLDQQLALRLQRLGVDELPESIGDYDTAAFSWDLYAFQGQSPSLGGALMVDYAIAGNDSDIYLAGLYAVPDEYDTLHDAVFLPAVDALAPLE
jgi:pimeloyl-ACP methyl ester carboxylesterase